MMFFFFSRAILFSISLMIVIFLKTHLGFCLKILLTSMVLENILGLIIYHYISFYFFAINKNLNAEFFTFISLSK